jgi:hypothetical protein
MIAVEANRLSFNRIINTPLKSHIPDGRLKSVERFRTRIAKYSFDIILIMTGGQVPRGTESGIDQYLTSAEAPGLPLLIT